MNGYLLLETGSVYQGTFIVPPAGGASCGEVVFNTSMTGYQEIFTDPSYCGQIILLTYPLIGNYGINQKFEESSNVFASGIIVKDAYHGSDEEKDRITSYLKDKSIPLFTGLDTRKLTREIRDMGTVKAFFLSDEIYSSIKNEHSIVEYCVKNIKPAVEYGSEVKHASTKKIVQLGGRSGSHIVLLDCGCKRGIINNLLIRGCRVTMVPYNTDSKTILSLNPDGIVLSNGPGDPKSVMEDTKGIKDLIGKLPMLGICLGHQLLALHMGGDTYKLKYGHRGANHPAQEIKTGKVWITSQNHGYSVSGDSLPKDVEITHINLNDGTIEGLKHSKYPILSVQFHPEGSPGPKDSEEIFDNFLELVDQFKYGDYYEKRIS